MEGRREGEKRPDLNPQGVVQVPDGHVWLQGDNLPNSTDSRHYGPVPLALIRGKVFYKARRVSLPFLSDLLASDLASGGSRSCGVEVDEPGAEGLDGFVPSLSP